MTDGHRSACILIVALLCAAPAWGLSYTGEYQPSRHYRMYRHPDKEFLGYGYDWSGIAVTDGYVLTMISPSFWIGAAHAGAPSTVTFYEGNNPDGPSHAYQTADRWRMGDSDMLLGRLSQPLDPSHGIAHYAVPTLDTLSAVGHRDVWYWGRGAKLGRTAINYVSSTSEHVWFYRGYLDPEDQPDGVYGTSGDSSSPSFIIGPDNQPVAIGSHHYQTGDNSVAHWVDEINDIMAPYGEQLSLLTDTSPPDNPPQRPTSPTGIGETFTWTGDGDGVHWSDADNWDQNLTPGSGDTVVVENATTVQDIPVLKIAGLELRETDGGSHKVRFSQLCGCG